MTDQFFSRMRTRRHTPWNAVVAVLVVLLLVGGYAWRSVAAERAQAQPSRTAPVEAVTPLSRTAAVASYADVAKTVEPSVVTIRTEGKAKVSPTQFQGGDDFLRRFFGDESGQMAPLQPRTYRERALGSGVVVSKDGYILTNYHVVQNADQIRVDLTDGRTLAARVVGSDKPSDLALLKVNAADLHPIVLGDSDKAEVGDVVLAVGNPLGLGETVTMGIISAKNRSTSVGDGSYEDFLQTDAPINHGNSGGALVNTKGELVGINSQILSPSDGNIGIGFAIPANMARNVMDQLRKGGRVERGQLGVTVQPVTSDMAESLGLKKVGGAIVAGVRPDSAADHAGIRQGDVIESFNGQPVHDSNALKNRIAEMQPGSNASVTILRDGSEKTLSVRLDEAKGTSGRSDRGEPDSNDKAALGVEVAPLTPDLAQQAGVPKTVHGLIVEQVNPDGRAADAGIQSGDVIEQVNRQPVHSIDDLRAALRKSSDRPVLLLVNRQGNDVFVTVPAA